MVQALFPICVTSNLAPSLVEANGQHLLTALGAAVGPGGTGASFVSVLNIAALSALDTTGFLKGSLGYTTQNTDAYWDLDPTSTATEDGITIVAANVPATPGVGRWLRFASGKAALKQQQAEWFVDLGNSTTHASDENDGKTAETPLLTKTEIARRWGTWSPTLNSEVVIFYLGTEVLGDQGGSDTGFFAPNFQSEGSLAHTATLPAAGWTGTLNAVTAKNRAGNHGLSASVNTTTGTIAAGMLLVNATRGNSRAFVAEAFGGGTWLITQPFAPYTGSGFPAATEVDTWATTDAVSGYVLPNVDLARIGGVAGGNPICHLAWGIAICDPKGGFNACEVDGASCFPLVVECSTSRTLTWDDSGAMFNSMAVHEAAPLFNSTQDRIVVMGGYLSDFNASGTLFQDDVILDTAGNPELLNCSFSGGAYFLHAPGNPYNFSGQTSVQGILYGTGELNFVSGSCQYTSETAVVAFPTSGGLQLGGASTAYSNATAAGVVTVHALALTPAALDAAAGAAGFGGYATACGATLSKASLVP